MQGENGNESNKISSNTLRKLKFVLERRKILDDKSCEVLKEAELYKLLCHESWK